jgi:hypothetical protein
VIDFEMKNGGRIGHRFSVFCNAVDADIPITDDAIELEHLVRREWSIAAASGENAQNQSRDQ